ncbi:MAG: hypothetical protein KGI38_13140, partial [Thaumarchaeota archaeon]|nr:hypothetical protein [Nitrososphaerota archaeon]
MAQKSETSEPREAEWYTAETMTATLPPPNKGKKLEIEVAGERWLRIPVKTERIDEHHNLLQVLEQALRGQL